MKFHVLRDPADFLERAESLLADEARHNLLLGIGNTLVTRPEVYPEFGLYLVSAGQHCVAAALMTRPYNLIIADCSDDDALQTLVTGLGNAGVTPPGFIGNRPTIDRFVSAWLEHVGQSVRLSIEQGVFALSRVEMLAEAPGAPRVLGPDDLELVTRWMSEFVAEALPDEPHDEKRARLAIERRLTGRAPGAYWAWVDNGREVALTGHGSPTGSGIRIGPVYTPQEHRRNGYASALVAEQSQWLLNQGFDFCFLYTDLANPTSNAIYERIGYRQVAESAVYLPDGSSNPAT